MTKEGREPLLIGGVSSARIASTYGTPLYVYDIGSMVENVRHIERAIDYRPIRLHFACMANQNTSLLRELREIGVGVFLCTRGELGIARAAGFAGQDMVITGSNFGEEDSAELGQVGGIINADSLQQLVKFVQRAGLKKVGIRINPNLTLPTATLNASAGPTSRLGILEADVPQVLRTAINHGVEVTGVHMYVGSNILDCGIILEAVRRLLAVARTIPTLEYVDIGGGFGVPYSEPASPFDWPYFGAVLSQEMNMLSRTLGRGIELKLEPGRAILASAGVLLTKVTEVKRHNGYVFVGTDTSMSNFARPYIYAQYHRVEPAYVSDNQRVDCHVYVCGNTVASNDFLAKDVQLPVPNDGDLLAIMDVGAYGFSMSSHFCGQPRPAEVMVKNRQVSLIRERESLNDLLRGQAVER